jgi:hypothetical protein
LNTGLYYSDKFLQRINVLRQVRSKDCVVVAVRETHKSLLRRTSPLVIAFSVRDVDQAIVLCVKRQQRLRVSDNLTEIARTVVDQLVAIMPERPIKNLKQRKSETAEEFERRQLLERASKWEKL